MAVDQCVVAKFCGAVENFDRLNTVVETYLDEWTDAAVMYCSHATVHVNGNRIEGVGRPQIKSHGGKEMTRRGKAYQVE